MTFGCEANKADSERIVQKLKNEGHQETSHKKKANLIVINACSVRKSAMDRVYVKVHENQDKQIILAGCLTEKDRKKLKNKVKEIWHPDEYFDLRPIYSSASSAHVPIMTGCNNYCTYCAVPYTRGREKSRPTKDIIKEVKSLVNPAFGGTGKNYKEIWLLGQNVNSYPDFPKLLKQINNIPGDFWIRFVSSHPKDFSGELIKTIAKCEKIVKEIHLPIQSGDNKILEKMNRGYTREKYIELVNKIRKTIPNIKISTDTIVGFPSETRKQFLNTVSLYKKIKFDKAYISEYSSRPGTMATMTMKNNVPYEEKKRRRKELEKVLEKNRPKDKIIVVLGSTASGKSDLAVDIAKKIDGEIISADSRQVYKGLNIGSGKITEREMKGVKHYLLDVISPKKVFTAIDFKNLAEQAIDEIIKKGKIPIVCGGTGFYIQTLLDNNQIPKIEPDWDLRKKLEKKSVEELFKMLKKLNPMRAENIDAKNKRRLIRAIEIIKLGTSDVHISTSDVDRFDILWLGIKKPIPELEKNISKRANKMIKNELEKEVKTLIKKYGWTKVLKNTIGYQEFLDKNPIEQIKLHSLQYAKRQITWFKKYAPKTHWLAPSNVEGIENKRKIMALINKFLRG